MIREQRPLDLVVAVGDLHAGRENNSLDKHRDTDDFFRFFLLPFIRSVKKKYPDRDVQVVFEGDLTDNKQLIGTIISNKMMDLVEEVSKEAVTHVLVGNHDTPLKDDVSINNNKSLGLYDNVTVYTQPQVIDTVAEEGVCMMSHFSNKRRFEEEVTKAAEIGASYLFGHNEVGGFIYDGELLDEKRSVSMELFKPFKKVYFGHIHIRQKKGNILYTGSPYHIRSDEWEAIPGVTLIDFKNGKEFFMENKFSPRYKRISLFDLLKMTKDEAEEFCFNSHVWVIIPTEYIGKIDFIDVTRNIRYYRTMEPKYLSMKKLKAIEQNKEQNKEEDQEEFSLKNIDIMSQFSEYIKKVDSVIVDKQNNILDDDKKERLVGLVSKLYSSAQANLKSITQEIEI
jgi:hypothetical protein